VDRDGGYTGWTPAQFVEQMRSFAQKHGWDGPLYPCLDHGGPWLKDRHALDGLSLDETMAEVKCSLTACLQAGYRLLHIDPTVDRSMSPGETLSAETVAARTLELIEYTEAERLRLRLPTIAYEVGTEEVDGGLADYADFQTLLRGLHRGLGERGLRDAWPCFVVGKVGTDLHTTQFDTQVAARLFDIVSPLGSLIKGHYTDWVANPDDYPATGMGCANVGPEFTAVEVQTLADLCAKEAILCRSRPDSKPSGFMQVLEQAVVDSDRWRKWLRPEEQGRSFAQLVTERRAWLLQTGSRYVWTVPSVRGARQRLYDNLGVVIPDPHQKVVDRVAEAIEHYILTFHLFDAVTLFEARQTLSPRGSSRVSPSRS
jgi:D-tagatose-1,6-bisphosphate aldolase subunit GatZ/KbaZ